MSEFDPPSVFRHCSLITFENKENNNLYCSPRQLLNLYPKGACGIYIFWRLDFQVFNQFLIRMRTRHIAQWNSSKLDPPGTWHFVLVRRVSCSMNFAMILLKSCCEILCIMIFQQLNFVSVCCFKCFLF